MIFRYALRWFLRLVGLVVLLALASWPLFWPRADERGTWRTDGYGIVVEISRFWVTGYQETALSCLPFFSAPGHSLILSEAGEITLGTDGPRLTLDVEGTVNTIHADRLDDLPAVCAEGGSPALPGTAQQNADIAWTAMAENYPFFDLHGVDWAARRPDLPAGADADVLWAALTDMLEGVDDGHVYLADPAGQRVFRPGREDGSQDDILTFREQLRSRGLTGIDDTGLEFAVLPGNIGYVFLRHTETRPGFGTTNADIAHRAFEQVADALKNTRAIILDNRLNPGGSDTVALAYASYFTDVDVTAFTKQTRTATGYTAPVAGVARGRELALKQPVYLLNSSMTASAAEIFAMAMGELDHVTMIGEPTSGAFSDIMEINLPNGWILGLSHQVYRDASGEVLETLGVAPDVERPFDADALRRGHDPLMDEVTRMIER